MGKKKNEIFWVILGEKGKEKCERWRMNGLEK